MVFLCSCPVVTTSTSFWKDFIPLISSIVVICLFIIDRIIGFYLRKKEVERNWYLKVLIEPEINKISIFYKDTFEGYKASAEFLKISNQKPHNDYISLKSIEFGKFQSLKRELEAEVIFPIQIRYPNVGESVTEELRNLEDHFTSCLDSELFSEDNIKQFQLYIAKNRAFLLKKLYSPLQKQRTFFFFLKCSKC